MQKRDVKGKFIKTLPDPTLINCFCGCLQKIPSHDKRGRPHKYILGHQKGNWRGGRRVNTQGYIEIFSPKHPYKTNRNAVKEHRLIMEKHLNRYLTKNEIVHHIDRNRQNNSIKNLKLMTKIQHDRLTASKNIFFTKNRPYHPWYYKDCN